MGQKINPKGFRVGVYRDWDARWFAGKKDYTELLHEDIALRDMLKKRLYAAGIARIEIERAANRLIVTIHAARPGMIIGRGGAGVEQIRRHVEAFTKKQSSVNIVEVKAPELDAQLVAESVASSLERRVSFRRAMKQAIGRTMRFGALGVKIMCSGRLGGAEMARREAASEGTVPLHTLRADIDYGFAEAKTTYGQIGVKVWICRPEGRPVMMRSDRAERAPRERARREAPIPQVKTGYEGSSVPASTSASAEPAQPAAPAQPVEAAVEPATDGGEQ